jgi:hypothetical protein
MTVIRPSDENHWITGPLMLEVFFTAEDGMPPLICGIDGRVHAGSINDIESSLVEEVTDGDLFSDGAGSYYIRCAYNQAQTDGYGRVECPAHWEFDRVGFQELKGNEV